MPERLKLYQGKALGSIPVNPFILPCLLGACAGLGIALLVMEVACQ